RPDAVIDERRDVRPARQHAAWLGQRCPVGGDEPLPAAPLQAQGRRPLHHGDAHRRRELGADGRALHPGQREDARGGGLGGEGEARDRVPGPTATGCAGRGAPDMAAAWARLVACRWPRSSNTAILTRRSPLGVEDAWTLAETLKRQRDPLSACGDYHPG